MKSVNIVAIANNSSWKDPTGLAALFTIGEIRFSNVSTFVDNVIAKAGSSKINKLVVHSHGGSYNGIYLGHDYFSLNDFNMQQENKYVTKLTKLKGLFAENGYIDLLACYAGKSPQFLVKWAQTINCCVIGGTDITSTLGGDRAYNQGVYYKAYPNGTFIMRHMKSNLF